MKKKILALFVAAMLLSACVIGVLLTDASAEGTYYYVRSSADPEQNVYASVDAALSAAEEKSWGENDRLVVLIDDALYTSESLALDDYGILFGQKTIWRGAGENKSKLPITIDVKGGNSFTFTVPGGRSMACANDYTFRNLTLPVGDASSSTRFYAGSGEVTFEYVDFGVKHQGVFLGDNFTKAAYIGWDELEDGEVVTSSLTFGKGTTYGCDPTLNDAKAEANEGFVVLAAGFPVASSAISGSNEAQILEKASAVTFNDADLTSAPDIRPRNTKVGIVIDTGSDVPAPTGADIEFGALHGRPRSNGYTPVDELFIELRSGVVVGIMGDDCDSAADSYVGDVTISIYGGDVSLGDPQVRALRCTLYGDLTINVGQRYGVKTNVGWIQSEFSTPGADVYGKYTFRMTGGRVGRYYGAPNATKGSVNEVTGGILGSFDGSRVTQTGELKNVIKGYATITGDFYSRRGSSVSSAKIINEIGEKANLKGAFYSVESGTADMIENRISGGTFGGIFYGTGLAVTCGNVLNEISGNPVFKTTFVAGTQRGTVTGNITNNISGGSFGGAFFGGSLGDMTENSVKITENVTDSASATFAEVTTKTTYTVKYDTSIQGTIFNNISGGSFSNYFYGGSKIGSVNKIVNKVTGGNFANSFFGGGGGSFSNATKVNRAQYNSDGTFKMTEDGSKVSTTSVTLESNRIFVSSINTIENTIDLPADNQVKSMYLGGYFAKVGNVTNEIVSGSFSGYFAGGGYGGELIRVENTVKGGTFLAPDGVHFCYYGGLYSGTMSGSVTNILNGGVFKKYFIAGSSTANIYSTDSYAIKNVVNGGTYSNFWGGSGGSSANVQGDIINEISGGTFDSYLNDGTYYYAAFNGGCRNAKHLQGNIITTVFGGIFYHNFYPGATPGSSDYIWDCPGTITTRLVGGDFYAKVYVSSYKGSYSKANLILDPDFEDEKAKNKLNICSSLGMEGTSEIEGGNEPATTVILDSTKQNPIYVNAGTRIYADVCNDAWICHQSRWEEGITYLTMPAQTNVDAVHFKSVDSEGGWIKTIRTGDSVTWVGCNGLLGASLVLTDRIAAKVYFDKKYVDDLTDWSLSFSDINGNSKKIDIVGGRISDENYVKATDTAYVLTLPSVAASDFHRYFTVRGEKFGAVSFSILDLCRNAVDYEYSGKTGDFAYLAKNIYNLGLEACKVFHDAPCFDSEASPYSEAELVDEYLSLADDVLDTSAIRKGAFKFVAAPLVLESGMGIQFYGRYDGSDSLNVYVNGTHLNQSFYAMEKITPTAANGQSNYRFTLRVKAAYLHETLVVGVRAGNESAYSQIGCSIAAACNQYVAGDRDFAVTRALLSYIEAVYHYNNREEILAERRRIAWEEMYRMMTVIWTPTEDFSYSHNNSYFTSDGEFAGDATKSLKKFKAGTYYSGIPYAHGSASTNAFLATGTGNPDQNGVYTISPTFDHLTGSPSWARLGNDCNDAVFWAWAASCARIYNTSSAGCVPKNGVLPVGDYDMAYKDDGGLFNIEEGTLVSNPATLYGKTPYIWLYNEAVHGSGTMYEALAKLQPGDGLVYHIVTAVAEDDADETGDAAGHVMMVQDIHVERKADGSVDPDKSYLLLMDQTSSPMGSGTLTDPHAKWQKYWNEDLGAYVYQCPNVNRDLNGDGVFSAKVSGAYTNNEALHKRTFTNCAPKWNATKLAYSGGYLPITATDFEDASPLPNLKITDSLTDTEMDFDSIFDGYLVSNYRISHANFFFYDQNGTLVKSFKAFGKESEFNTNSNHDHLFRFTRLNIERDEDRNIYGNSSLYDLQIGKKYTCVVTVQAGTMEDIEVRRFDFTARHAVVESPDILLK